jgi:hypothetical protein
MQAQLLDAFKVLDSRATPRDMLEACRYLFIHSDEYQLARHPFDQTEVDAVARAIYEYILFPDAPSIREIVFTVDRPIEGKAIEYSEYASRFSGDMLSQSFSREVALLGLEDLRCRLKAFLVGMLFRDRKRGHH